MRGGCVVLRRNVPDICDMKKSLIAFFLLLCGVLSAAPGDTTVVNVHNATHMSWYGNYDAWGVFPPVGTSWRKILMHYKLSCPSTGCSDWDYTTQIFASADSTQFWELGRMITPYGGSYSLSWNNTITYDVTDFAPILHDSLLLRAFYSGWSDGFAVTLRFEFIEGIPPRNVTSITNMWNGNFSYGVSGDPIEGHVNYKPIVKDPGAVAARLRFTPTGHGADGTNCAEFCSKWYQVKTSGTTLHTQSIWKNDCGMNPLFPQAGTWIYDRANWCPGDVGYTFLHDVTSAMGADSVRLDVDFEPYTMVGTSSTPIYTVESQLVQYGPINHTLDVEITEIVSPNNRSRWFRDNPTCDKPQVRLQNSGSTNLSSFMIYYGVEGGTMNAYNWTGTLNFGQEILVSLPSMSFSAASDPDNFIVYVDSPNGMTDEYHLNDTMRSTFNKVEILPNKFEIYWKTNNRPSETSWKIYNSSGTIVKQSSPFLTAATTYRDTTILGPGCYTFHMIDSDKDGLYFFNNSDGTGWLRFQQANGTSTLIKQVPNDFGTAVWYRFEITTALDVKPALLYENFMDVYPNPARDLLNLDIHLTSGSPATIRLFNEFGVEVWRGAYAHLEQHTVSIPVYGLSAGMYVVELSSEAGQLLRRVVVE